MLKTIETQLQKIPRKAWLVLIVLFSLILINVAARVYSARQLQQKTKQEQLPLVAVTRAKAGEGTEQLILPGNVTAWHDATIYARTNGYIKKWYVDIGTKVKEGQLLAVIETPELDAQLRQAKADLNTAIANNSLAQSTAKRWINLLKTASVSQQETNEKVSAAAALTALVAASEANVNRLQELVNFERVNAPFDGVITARHTDIGALINQGSGTNIPLFELAQTNPLRVYVKIPQNYAAQVKANMRVQLRFAEHPGQEFSAQLMQTAQALDPRTRTLLAQFKVDNSKGVLLAGGYTEVRFTLPLSANTIRIPVNALLFQAAGLQIAILDKNHRVELRSVTISRDFGNEVEIKSGIKPGERIILYPPDSINNGEQVRVAS